MNKLMDKLTNNVKFDKKYVIFSIVIILLGIITGAFFIVILNTSDKSLVIEYIESFIDNIKSNNINYTDIFKNSIIINYFLIFIILIIGFTFILFPINIIILFYKSFVIGFTISSFILTYKLKGIILCILYIFPHLIINILMFAIIISYTTKLSIKMISNIIKKRNVNMREYFNKYFYVIFLFLLLFLITSIYETFISTYLIKSIANMIF